MEPDDRLEAYMKLMIYLVTPFAIAVGITTGIGFHHETFLLMGVWAIVFRLAML